MTQIKSFEILDLIEPLLRKGRAVALTGAGISAESGIPTFRGKGGFWEKYEPAIFANTQGLLSTFRENPEKIVDFLTDLYSVLLKAKPNSGHTALARMEKAGLLECLITQNIDDLHRVAGSKNILELHGNAFQLRCERCLRKFRLDREKLAQLLQEMNKFKNSKMKLLKIFSQFFPKCACGDRLRIDIVLFGEMLDANILNRAYEAIESCPLLLIVGTSGVVYPSAELPFVARRNGAKIVEINNETSELSFICDYQILGKAGEILPKLISNL